MVVRGTRYQTSSLQNEFCVWQALSFDYRLQYKISDTGYIGTELKKGTIDQGVRVRPQPLLNNGWGLGTIMYSVRE